jgi:hypothetical protein
MDKHNGPASELAGYRTVGDWLDHYAGPFFSTRSSFEWLVKRNRDELVEVGALIPRQGRSGSLVSVERMPKAVLEILKRRALAERKDATAEREDQRGRSA